MKKNNQDSFEQARDLLLENEDDLSSVMKEGGLLKKLTKRIIERALSGEIKNHLGYDK